MGPAEIVASLKEFCEGAGPKFQTNQIVDWIEQHSGYPKNAELIAFAKKMKARQYARMLMYDDEESGWRIKRLWSFFDKRTGERHYHDIADLSPERRRKLIAKYARFTEQLRSVRKAMADYFAGQEFFEFYSEPPEPKAVKPKFKRKPKPHQPRP